MNPDRFSRVKNAIVSVHMQTTRLNEFIMSLMGEVQMMEMDIKAPDAAPSTQPGIVNGGDPTTADRHTTEVVELPYFTGNSFASSPNTAVNPAVVAQGKTPKVVKKIQTQPDGENKRVARSVSDEMFEDILVRYAKGQKIEAIVKSTGRSRSTVNKVLQAARDRGDARADVRTPDPKPAPIIKTSNIQPNKPPPDAPVLIPKDDGTTPPKRVLLLSKPTSEVHGPNGKSWKIFDKRVFDVCALLHDGRVYDRAKVCEAYGVPNNRQISLEALRTVFKINLPRIGARLEKLGEGLFQIRADGAAQ